MTPDERVFREHLTGPTFCDGVQRGRWRIAGNIDWPYVLVAVSAAPREGAPTEYFLRFDLAGYPAAAPTATPWDPATESVLGANSRPKGERLSDIFRSDWENGRALYAPFDRVALGYHADWSERYREQAWDAMKDIAWLLRFVHRLLNDDDYRGT